MEAAAPGPAGVKDLALAEIVAVIEACYTIYKCLATRPATAAAAVSVGFLARQGARVASFKAMPGAARERRVRTADAVASLGDRVTAADLAAVAAEIATRSQL